MSIKKIRPIEFSIDLREPITEIIKGNISYEESVAHQLLMNEESVPRNEIRDKISSFYGEDGVTKFTNILANSRIKNYINVDLSSVELLDADFGKDSFLDFRVDASFSLEKFRYDFGLGVTREVSKYYKNGDEGLLLNDSEEYRRLEEFARLLTINSPNHQTYVVEDTYLDFGQNWKWTTIINVDEDYQALTPREWKEIVNKDRDYKELMNEHFSKGLDTVERAEKSEGIDNDEIEIGEER